MELLRKSKKGAMEILSNIKRMPFKWLALLLISGGIYYLYLDRSKRFEPEHQVIQDIRFGPDKNTFVFRLCPLRRKCRIATYNIIDGKGYFYEFPFNPTPRWHNPSFSWDGQKIAVAGDERDGTYFTVISVEDRTYRRVGGVPRYRYAPIFAPDGKSIYSFSSLRKGEMDNKTYEYVKKSKKQKYGIFETSQVDGSERRISNHISSSIYKLAATPSLVLFGEYKITWVEGVGWGSDEDGQFIGALRKEGRIHEKLSFLNINTHEFKNNHRNYIISEDVYFQGSSRNNLVLFSMYGRPKKGCGISYDLFIANKNKEITKVTDMECGYFSNEVDISKNGNRIVYRTAVKLPATSGYRNFILWVASNSEIEELKKDVGLFLIDADGTNHRKLSLPERLESYERIELRPEERRNQAQLSAAG